MANREDNLITQGERTPEERRRVARNGGIKSGQVRREKRSMREIANIILSTKANADNQAQMKKYGIDTATLKDMIVYKVIQDFQKNSNYKALETLLDITGEKCNEVIVAKQRQEIEKLKLECEKLKQELNIGGDTYEDLTPLVEKLKLKDGD